MKFVDTHCHLDDEAFAHDLDEVIAASVAAGVTRFINIGYEPSSWLKTLDLANRHPQLFYALGLHPNSADCWSNELADQLFRALSNSSPVAIGESGLDFFRDHADRDGQREAFRAQLTFAQDLSLPIVIHMRGDVEGEIMSTLSEYPDVPLVFHSFDGSSFLRDFALERESWIGIGGLMTRKGSSELREILTGVPLDRLILETDAPYLVPAGSKSRRNSPAAIPTIAEALANLFNILPDEVAVITTANAERAFPKLSHSSALQVQA